MNSEANCLVLRVQLWAVNGEHPPEDQDVFRDLSVPATNTLADLGRAIVATLLLEPADTEWAFFLSGEMWDVETEVVKDETADEDDRVASVVLVGEVARWDRARGGVAFAFGFDDSLEFGVVVKRREASDARAIRVLGGVGEVSAVLTELNAGR
jgi:hypothetical protein